MLPKLCEKWPLRVGFPGSRNWLHEAFKEAFKGQEAYKGQAQHSSSKAIARYRPNIFWIENPGAGGLGGGQTRVSGFIFSFFSMDF